MTNNSFSNQLICRNELDELKLHWQKTTQESAKFLFPGTCDHIKPLKEEESFHQSYEKVGHGLSEEMSKNIRDAGADNSFNIFTIFMAAMLYVLAEYLNTEIVIVKTPWVKEPDDSESGNEEATLVAQWIYENETIGDLIKGLRKNLVRQYKARKFWYYLQESIVPTEITTNILCYCRQIHGSNCSENDMDIVFHVSCDSNQLAIEIKYKSEVLSRLIVETVLERIVRFLDYIDTPKLPLKSVSLLTSADKEIYKSLNQTNVPCHENETLSSIFEAITRSYPEAVAIKYIDQEYSYQFINDQANLLANKLITKSANVGGSTEFIGVLGTRSVQTVIAVIAVIKSGKTFVTLNHADGPERIKGIIDDVGLATVVTEMEDVSWLTVLGVQVISVLKGVKNTPTQQLPKGFGSDTAYLIYTSGSTGKPKGVAVKHKSILNTLQWRIKYYKFVPSHVHLLLFPFVFDGSLTAVFSALLSGGCLVIPQERLGNDPDYLANLIYRHNITHFICVPSLYQFLISTLRSNNSLLAITLAGEMVHHDIVQQHHNKFDNVALYNEYGPTENAVCTSIARLYVDQPVTIGRPIDNVKVYVMNRRLTLLPVGAIGELYIGGINMAVGYLNKVELTNESFIPDPYHPLQRIYSTGDLVRINEKGNIEYIGRNDSQVKIKGYRVEVAEVENALLGQNKINECAVVPYYSDKQPVLRAFFTKKKMISLWPSLAEYFLYEDILYRTMANDVKRNKIFLGALKKVVVGKVVLEIGPGAEAILSLMCVKCGAKKVYAVEILEEAYQKAKKKIESLGLTEKIVLIHADIKTVHLPEQVDYCVSEIVGSIGGAEGAAVLINSAKKWLHNPANMIPKLSITRIAAVTLPETEFSPGFDELGAHYVSEIFSYAGKKFDLRLCLNSFPVKNVISSKEIFEYLDFTKTCSIESHHEIEMKISKDSVMHGCILWLHLYCDDEYHIDTLEGSAIWLPVFLPIFPLGQEVKVGDSILATVSVKRSENNLNPDYWLNGYLLKKNGKKIVFKVDVPHIADTFMGGDFYKKVFRNGNPHVLPELNTTTLSKALRNILPEYMLPGQFIEIENMPRKSSGKIDRKALENYIPASNEYELDNIIAPGDAIEGMLADVWKDVLNLEVISIHTKFFLLGGDSIKAIQVASRIRAKGYNIDIRDIMRNLSIYDLKSYVKPGAIPSQQSQVEGNVPLTPIQKKFFKEFNYDKNFNQAVILKTQRGNLDKKTITEVLNKLLLHHDALRMSFSIQNELVVQYNHRGVKNLPIYEYDLVSEKDIQQAIISKVEKLQTFIQLEQAPMMIVALFRTKGEDRLLFIIHHLIIDGVSWRIFLEDFGSLYNYSLRKLPYTLPYKTTSYKQWAESLRVYGKTEKCMKEVGFWKALVACDFDQITPDFNQTEVIEKSNVIKWHGEFTEKETAALLSKAAHLGADVEVIDILLAALAISIKRFFSKDRILIELEGHGREGLDIDVSRTIGWFTVLYPLLLEAIPGMNAEDQVNHIRKCRNKIPNGGITYGILKYMISTVNEEQHNLLCRPSILFNYLGQFDSQIPGTPLEVVFENLGNLQNADSKKEHFLIISGWVFSGQLQLSLEYNNQQFKKETISLFGKILCAELRNIISICDDLKTDINNNDFYQKNISAEQLNTIFE